MQSPASSFLDDVADLPHQRPDAHRHAEEGRSGLPRPADDALLLGDPDATCRSSPRASTPRPSRPGRTTLREWVKNRSAVVVRNPHWNNAKEPWKSLGGPRNARPDHVTRSGTRSTPRLLRLRRNETDLGAHRRRPRTRSSSTEFGINKSRYFVRKQLVFWYLALNNDSALFRNNVKLRQAVNCAIDRPQIVRQHGFLAGGRTDQILPPGMPGFKDARSTRSIGVNDGVAHEGEGARQRPHPRRQGGLLRASRRAGPGRRARWSSSTCARSASTSRSSSSTARSSTRRWARAASRSTSGIEGWGADYPDPSNFVNVLLDGKRHPGREQRQRVVLQRPGVQPRRWRQPRGSWATLALTAYGNLDNDITKNQAPLATYINSNARMFISQDTGCFTYSFITSTPNLVAMCKK